MGTLSANSTKKAKPVMIGDMDAVVERMVAVVNKEGSVMELPWAMCAKLVGFMWDPIAHCFELRYLASVVRRDFQMRMGGTARHKYQALTSWTWQALHEVVDTLDIMTDFLPEALMAKSDLVWLEGRLRNKAREAENMFTANDTVVLVAMWMAEYATYIRTVYCAAKRRGMRGAC